MLCQLNPQHTVSLMLPVKMSVFLVSVSLFLRHSVPVDTPVPSESHLFMSQIFLPSLDECSAQ